MGVKQRPFVPIIIVGGGFSGLAAACRLQQKFGFTDYQIYERSEQYGGTWWNNQYPGCGVDVPSIYYSLSFRPDREFSHLFADQADVLNYIRRVAREYDVEHKIQLNTEWVEARWQESSRTWIHLFEDKITGERFEQESKLIFSAVGGLVNPKECDIPGVENFEGQITHTAQWDHTTVVKDKNVIVIGNGCSATQVIPAIVDNVKSITQFIRTPQYYFKRFNPAISPNWRWAFQHVPGFLWGCRTLLFTMMERGFGSFYLTEDGAKKREVIKKFSMDYIHAAAPKEYWPLLTPSYENGCKRRIFDPGYVETLHYPNVHATMDPIVHINANSVSTKSGIEYPADTIILANGFDTTSPKFQMFGRGGITPAQHWLNFGGVEAYKGVALNSFPNMFMIFGPNSGAGHQSAVYAIENAVELILRIAEPVIHNQADSIEIQLVAEHTYCTNLHKALDQRVWNKNCNPYYVDQATGWNFALYPYSSYYMWWETRFPTLKHWDYTYTPAQASARRVRMAWNTAVMMGTCIAAAAGSGFVWLHRSGRL